MWYSASEYSASIYRVITIIQIVTKYSFLSTWDGCFASLQSFNLFGGMIYFNEHEMRGKQKGKEGVKNVAAFRKKHWLASSSSLFDSFSESILAFGMLKYKYITLSILKIKLTT